MFKPLSPTEALARQLEQTQTRALAQLTDVDPLRVIYTESGWRVQDIITHLTAWEEEVIRSLQAHLYNSSYHIPDFELEAFNQTQYQQRRFLPYRQVTADWLAARNKLRWLVTQLKPEKMERQMIYPSGRSGECLALIHEVMSHQNEHMQDVLDVLSGKKMNSIDKLAWIHIVDRKILITRSKGKDTYYIPGGKREAGETDLQALAREIKEELSVELVPDSVHYVGTFEAQAHGKPEGVMVTMTCYMGDYTGEITAASEIAEVAWFQYRDKAKTSPVDHLIFDWLREQELIS